MDKVALEWQVLRDAGLLPNPNECMPAQWVGLPSDPTRLESEYEQLLHTLARDLERMTEARDAAVREGYELRETATRLASALRHLAAQHELTPAQAAMVRWLVYGSESAAEDPSDVFGGPR